MFLASLISSHLDYIELTSLSHHILFDTLTSAYQLLNNALPACFGEYWLCIPPGSD